VQLVWRRLYTPSRLFSSFLRKGGILVINFSQLSSPEEKLLVLFLYLSKKPLTQKQIYTELALNRSRCNEKLIRLVESGILEKITNEYGITLYSFVSEKNFDVPKRNSDVPKRNSDVPKRNSDVPKRNSDVPERNSDVPKRNSDVPKRNSDVPKRNTDVPKRNTDVPERNSDVLKRNSEATSNSAQFKLKDKEKKFKKEKEIFVEKEKEETAELLPLVHTPLATKPRSQPPRAPKRDDMETLSIPLMVYQEEGDFDGFIYAKELHREKYLDRMLSLIGFDSVGSNTTLKRYDFFKIIIEKIFRFFYLANKKKAVFDEVTHRIAFAVAMEAPNLKDEYELAQFLQECESDVKENKKSGNDIYVWRPALRRLRRIYFHKQWGWDTMIFDTTKTWDNETLLHPERPRIELFPAKRQKIEELNLKENRKIAKQQQKQQQFLTPEEACEEARQFWVKQFKTNPNNISARKLLRETYGMTPEQLKQIIAADSLEEALLVTPNTLELVTA
jgi:DNA-binding transcriptional regulator GbsR (MarR family)